MHVHYVFLCLTCFNVFVLVFVVHTCACTLCVPVSKLCFLLFQVMNCKFSIICLLAEKSASFGKKSFASALPALVDKLADIKVKGISGDTLLMIAEKMTLNYTSLQVTYQCF